MIKIRPSEFTVRALILSAIGLCALLIFSGCKNKKVAPHDQKMIVEHVSFESVEDDMGPPPPDFKSPFKTIPDWLNNLCAGEKPEKSIDQYRFSLFESPGEYILSITGTSTYTVSPTQSETKIEFAPNNMYFLLPEEDYKGLKREELLQKLTAEFRQFIDSDTFRKSFLAQAKSVSLDWKGEIWTRP